jgi:adenine-specific DNA methylase
MLQLGKSATRSRKLAIWSSLPPYLGGKRRLCPTIFREIDRIVPRRTWARLTFLDGFLGGGSVSLYAKAQGFAHVTACDIAERGIVVGQALIENSRVKLTREDVLRLVAPDGSLPGRVEKEMVPAVFTRDQARFIDRAMCLAGETSDRAKAALFRLMAIRVALLAHPMSQVRAGTIHRLETGEYESITESCMYHYVDGLRLTRPKKLWEIAQAINAGVFAGNGSVLKESVLDALPRIHAHVAYFDPPYPGVMSYEKEYRFIDQILEGLSRPTSPFTAKDGASLLDHPFQRAQHIPVWVLSLGNAVVGIDELEAKMSRLGRETRAIEIAYQHLPAVANEEKKATNKEFLVVGWDPAIVDRLLAAVARDHSIGIQFGDNPTTLVEKDPHAIVPEPTPSKALLNNALEKGHADDTHELGSLGRRITRETGRRMDQPDPVTGKRRTAGDRVGRRTRNHDSE